MKQQFQLRSLFAAIGLTAMIVAAPTASIYALGRGGGFSRGGFSREGAAAAGSFASRSGSMLGHERGLESGARGAEASRMEQANRMEYGEHAQTSRQQEANALQSNREQAAKNMQSAAQQYHGAYPYGGRLQLGTRAQRA